jgi:hypothetical protein
MATGRFVVTGYVPSCLPKMIAGGAKVSASLFDPRHVSVGQWNEIAKRQAKPLPPQATPHKREPVAAPAPEIKPKRSRVLDAIKRW